MPSRQKCTLSRAEVHAYAAEWLKPLRLKDRGTQCTRAVIIRVLFLAAARISSVGAVCKTLARGPCGQAVYDALAVLLPRRVDLLQRRLNACLQSQLPPQLTQRRRLKKLLYVAWGYHASPIEIRELYRRRFAIETSYRQMNQARIRTSTRDPLERLVYFTIALILRNVWVWLHGTLLFTYRRGQRVLRLELLRFREMLTWLAQQTIHHLHDATPYTIEWNP